MAALILVAATALHDSGSAVAQDVPDTTAAECANSPLDGERTLPDPPGHRPFSTWDEGPAVIPFESEPPAEQAALMKQAERFEMQSGYGVAENWSAYSHERAQDAVVEAARRLSGLTGTDDIGVAP